MTVIKSIRELQSLLQNFTFEEIGFIRISTDEKVIEYHKKRRYRSDLYVKVNPENFEAQIYRCNEAGQPEISKGTFNIGQPDELLFLLTHCLNELQVDSSILETYKRQINYNPSDVVPTRSPSQI